MPSLAPAVLPPHARPLAPPSRPQKLRREAERAKRALSSQHQVRVEIESLVEGVDLSGEFSVWLCGWEDRIATEFNCRGEAWGVGGVLLGLKVGWSAPGVVLLGLYDQKTLLGVHRVVVAVLLPLSPPCLSLFRPMLRQSMLCVLRPAEPLTRARFEELNADPFKKTMGPVRKVRCAALGALGPGAGICAWVHSPQPYTGFGGALRSSAAPLTAPLTLSPTLAVSPPSGA